MVEQKRNVMAHAQKPDLVFQRNGRVHLYRWGCQFSRLLAAEVCASAVVMLDRPCPIQCKTVLATPSICLFPLHFSTRAFPCAITFRFHSTTKQVMVVQKITICAPHEYSSVDQIEKEMAGDMNGGRRHLLSVLVTTTG